MGGVGINLFNWLSQGCMVLSLIKRYLLKLLCQGKGWRIEESGMFVLFENLMIGRWIKGYIFFVYWELILLQWRNLIGILISSHIITNKRILPQLSSLGKLYGK